MPCPCSGKLTAGHKNNTELLRLHKNQEGIGRGKIKISRVFPEGLNEVVWNNFHRYSELEDIIPLIFDAGGCLQIILPLSFTAFPFSQGKKKKEEEGLWVHWNEQCFVLILKHHQNQGLVLILTTHRWGVNFPSGAAPGGRVVTSVSNAIWPCSAATHVVSRLLKTQNARLSLTSNAAPTGMGGLVWPLARE